MTCSRKFISKEYFLKVHDDVDYLDVCRTVYVRIVYGKVALSATRTGLLVRVVLFVRQQWILSPSCVNSLTHR